MSLTQPSTGSFLEENQKHNQGEPIPAIDGAAVKLGHLDTNSFDCDQDEVMDFLREPNLLDYIAQDIDVLGYVGEDRNKKLLCLCALSRKLHRPFSIILQAHSSAGKSELLGHVVSLQDPNDVFVFSGMSPKAFVYLAKNDPNILRHKLVVIAEADGSKDANYYLRTLLSEQTLTHVTVIGGKPVTITLNGPIAYIETTTQPALNVETFSRMYELPFDGSATQTSMVNETILRHAMQSNDEPDKRIINRHVSAQRALHLTNIIIPENWKIDFPSNNPLCRRELAKFISVIGASAFLHQYQRDRRTDGRCEYIIADKKDFDIAHYLTADLIAGCLNVMPSQARAILDIIRQSASQHLQGDVQPHDFELTVYDVTAAYADLSPKQVSRWMEFLAERGHLERRVGGQGRKAKYGILSLRDECTIELTES